MTTLEHTGAEAFDGPRRVLVGGLAGSGLTLLGCTFPNPALAVLDGNLMAAAGRNVPFVRIDDTAGLIALMTTVRLDAAEREKALGVPVDTLVLDTLDRLEHLIGPDGDLRAWLQALRTLPVHVVLLCHLRHVDARLALDVSLGDQVGSYVDAAVALTARSTGTWYTDGAWHETGREPLLVTRSSAIYPWVVDRLGTGDAETVVDFTDDGAELLDSLSPQDLGAAAPAAPPTTPPKPPRTPKPPRPPAEAPEPESAAEPEPVPESEPAAEAEPEPAPVEEDGEPPLPFCGKCGDQIAEQADVDLSLLRRLWRNDDNEPVPLCRACGKEEYEAKAATPPRRSGGVARTPTPSDAEARATVPTGVPVGVIPQTADPDLHEFLNRGL